MRLNKLISFLESEVQNELRISMAVKGFNFKEEKELECTKKSRIQLPAKDVPSAHNLLAAKGKENSCIFCDKSDHDSAKCFKARNISLSEIQETVKRKRACFNCAAKKKAWLFSSGQTWPENYSPGVNMI